MIFLPGTVQPTGQDAHASEWRAMRVMIAGGGIGGMTLALALHNAGIDDIDIYESSSAINELGVGINVLPHATNCDSSVALSGVPSAAR